MLGKPIFIVTVSMLCAAVGGCATGPSISQTGAITQSVPKGKSQIVVYRTSLLAPAIQPVVLVDGQPKGTCVPNGAFNDFVTPGLHQLSATTETTERTTINAPVDGTVYVKCSIWIGVFIGRPTWEEVPASIAADEIRSLSFTGIVRQSP